MMRNECPKDFSVWSVLPVRVESGIGESTLLAPPQTEMRGCVLCFVLLCYIFHDVSEERQLRSVFW